MSQDWRYLIQERTPNAKDFRTIAMSMNYPTAASQYRGHKPTDARTVVRVLDVKRDLIFLHSEGKTGPVKRR